MEGIAGAASVVQIIALTEHVFELCGKYYIAVKNARKDVKRLQTQLVTLQDMFDSLQERFDDGASSSLTTVQKLRMNGFLSLCICELQELSEKLEKGQGIDRLGKRLFQWPFVSKEIESIVELFEQYKSSISLALGIDQSAQVAELTKNVSSISQGIDVLKLASTIQHDTLSHVCHDFDSMNLAFTATSADQNRRTIINWLCPVDPSLNHANAFAAWDTSTGTWFLSSSFIFNWKKVPNSFHSLTGIPGSGKTVLCAVVIERLIEDHANNVDLSYAYYYFDFRDREKQNALNFISSLCGQLCHWLDPIPKEVVLLYQTCHRGMQRPVITRLLSLFKGLVMKLKEVFIVIDAIDECPKGSDREGLLQALTTIKGFRLSNLHIMVSSRMESDIDNRLRCLITSPTMSLTNPSVNSDISRYIQHFIDSEPKLCRWPQHIKNDIQYSLSEQSRGMFRWVFCQLDILKKCLSVRDIQTALRTLPKTLEETYARILETVPEEYHEKLHKALYWLVFSRRPMTMEEIAEAMVSGPDCSNNWDENSKLNDPRDVLEVLGSLVMVTSSAMQKSHPITTHNFVDSKEDGETSSPSECSSDESEHHKLHDTRGKKKQLHSNELSLMLRKGAEELVQIGEKTVQFDRPEYAFPQIVTLAHASVQDYLLSQRIRCSSVASFAVDTAIANSYIMRSCLAYLLQLSHLKLAGAYSPGSGPLKDYACTYWFAHGSGILKDPDAQIATLRLLVKDAAVQEWIDFPNQTIPRYAYEVVLFSKRLPLPYAANDMGYQIIMQTLSGHDPAEYHLRAWSRRWPYALRDDGPVGRIAIDRIEELDITPGDGKVLLYAAAASNNNQLLTLLLDRGCNPNAFFEPDATALHVAAHHGHIDCVRTILTFQAELNARNANLETPLFVSSENNHEEVVFALIRAGASIGDETIYHWNALYVAAIKGHLNTVQHLVDAGANINWKTDSGETALSGAAWHQHHRIVDFLLQRQALSEHSADQRAKVLHDLISCGHIYLLQKFLDYGAEINSPDANGDTPLHIAADDCSRIDVMRVLLARGADIFYKNKRGENALFTAVRASNMEAMGLLLAAGIDIDSINDSDETALELASDHGYAQTVQYLIDCGASAVNLNIIPFTRNQNTDMVRTLIERGANRQRIGYNYGRIALHWAADYGFMDLVQLLALDQSDVGYEDDDGKTPAYYAAIQGHTSVVEYLQSKGARLPADAIVSQELVNLRNWRPV